MVPQTNLQLAMLRKILKATLQQCCALMVVVTVFFSAPGVGGVPLELQFASTPVLVSGSDLQAGSVYRFAKVASGVDAQVEVLRANDVQLLSVDNNQQNPNALQPLLRATGEEPYFQIAITLFDSVSNQPRLMDAVLSVVALSRFDQRITIAGVSDYTMEAASQLQVQSSAPNVISVGDTWLHSSNPADNRYTISVTMMDQSALVISIEPQSSGQFRNTFSFQSFDYADPVFHNVNDAPVALDDSHIVQRNEILRVNAASGLLANDFDADASIDGDQLSVESFSINSISYSSDSTTVAATGSITIASDGSYQFVPNVNNIGAIEKIDYRVVDASGANDTGTLVLHVGTNADRTIASAESLQLVVEEDSNKDGYISGQELQGLIDIIVMVPEQAVTGHKLQVSSQFQSHTIVLTANDLIAGSVNHSLDVPTDGEVLELSATYLDTADAVISQVIDTIRVDLTANEKPQISIVEDTDNSGFLSAQEFKNELTVRVELPATVVVNDIIDIALGNRNERVVLTPLDIAKGSVSFSMASASEGDTVSIVASITDEAGNQSENGSDSLRVDTVAPPVPSIESLLTISSTPTITGKAPVDADYLLSVEVNNIAYVVTDGHLQVLPGGVWELAIPVGNALTDGVYQVVATVADMAGNASVDSTEEELTVDLIAPALMAQDIGVSSDAAPLLFGSTDQPDGEWVTTRLRTGAPLCAAIVEQQTWSCRVRRQLAVGENRVVISTQDIAGNKAEYEFPIVVADSADTDGDGIADVIEGTVDTDQDGVADYTDLDSDNDGITDEREGMVDTDNDGVRDYLDTDSDNDGITDELESGLPAAIAGGTVGRNGLVERSGAVTYEGERVLPLDSDNDLIDDFRDLDSDNDGISDEIENNATALPDLDSDQLANYRDLDSDQDGIPDLLEHHYPDADGDARIDVFTDINIDGLHDNLVTSSISLDVDGDGLLNFVDIDSDGDGRADLREAGGVDADRDGRLDAFADKNSNGIADSVDNFYTQNGDEDGDGIDDLSDSDYLSGIDSDFDGIADAFDIDADGDGLADNYQIPASLSLVYQYQPRSGALLTGVGTLGSGCAMLGTGVGRNHRLDITFFVLLAVAACGLRYRRLRVIKT